MKISNVLANIANSKFMVNHIQKCDDAKFLTRTLLLTSVAKDVFAYGLRVKNTLENDKIPEDKKKFSAHMDMATGITTAAVQIGAGFLVSNDKLQTNIANKLFKPILNDKRAFNSAKTPLIASKMVYKLEHKNDNKNGNNAIGNKNNIETKNKSV